MYWSATVVVVSLAHITGCLLGSPSDPANRWPLLSGDPIQYPAGLPVVLSF